MKNQSLFIFSCLTLAACTPSSKNNGAGANPDLRARAMAAKPLSAEDKRAIKLLVVKQADHFPATELFYEKTVNSKSYQRLFAKLNETGRFFLNRIKTECQLDAGTDKESGGYKVGETNVKETTRS